MGTRPPLRRRFWVESALAGSLGALCVLTLVWHDWIEAVGYDPDHHNGSGEWFVVAGLFVLFLAFVLPARLEWRRAASAT